MVVLNKQDLHEATGQSVADREALSATLALQLEQALGNPVTSIDVREGCGFGVVGGGGGGGWGVGSPLRDVCVFVVLCERESHIISICSRQPCCGDGCKIWGLRVERGVGGGGCGGAGWVGDLRSGWGWV